MNKKLIVSIISLYAVTTLVLRSDAVNGLHIVAGGGGRVGVDVGAEAVGGSWLRRRACCLLPLQLVCGPESATQSMSL